MEIPRGDAKAAEGEHKRFIIPSQEPEAAPVRSLFQAPAAAQPSVVGSAGSYADYIFQKEAKVPEQKPPCQKPLHEKLNLGLEVNVQCEKTYLGPESKSERESSALASNLNDKEDPKTVTGSTAGQTAIPVLKPGGGRSCIVVSPRQRGNPLLKHVRNIPWEFGEIVPDYLLGETCCALFLSLRYHNLNPEYIHTRLRSLGQSYALRVLLVLVDVKDPHFTLKELAKICILSDCTLVLSWSPEEAARYLETYKCYEQKPADVLKERMESDFMSRITDCLTTVKSVNKTDSCTLLTTFGTLADLANASREDLSLCPGLGPQKAKRLFDALHEPFLKTK
ncbi:DNA excision repair protein ERCC-1 [Bufo bufo]|uniref:DNA excision repair protein ERCC-1 n=1 Tax=Bufo bufo TaxID=8384 RepID=UPI001ABE8AF2|nr:DNA excision repair protein ERCC-1 [Bufo bufo]XP_040292191.1 DNA excision repair protein ERCC-1 [Bufo bufo]